MLDDSSEIGGDGRWSISSQESWFNSSNFSGPSSFSGYPGEPVSTTIVDEDEDPVRDIGDGSAADMRVGPSFSSEVVDVE